MWEFIVYFVQVTIEFRNAFLSSSVPMWLPIVLLVPGALVKQLRKLARVRWVGWIGRWALEGEARIDVIQRISRLLLLAFVLFAWAYANYRVVFHSEAQFSTEKARLETGLKQLTATLDNERRYRSTKADELADMQRSGHKRYVEWWEHCFNAEQSKLDYEATEK